MNYGKVENISSTDSVPGAMSCDTSVFRITYGGPTNYQLIYLRSLPGDNVISVGQTEGSSIGGLNGWILKADRFGTIIWSKAYGGTQHDYFKKVIPTNDGGILAIGSLNNTDPTWPTGYAWAVKVDANGKPLWSYCIKILPSVMQDVFQTSDGGYALVATVNTSGSETKILVIKIGSSGNLEWMEQYSNGFSDYGYAIRQAKDGDLLVAGFGWGLYAGQHDGFMMKISSKNGNVLWMKSYGTFYDDVIDGFAEDGDGNLYLSFFWGVTEQPCVIKTDSLGNVLWANLYTTPLPNQRATTIKFTYSKDLILSLMDPSSQAGGVVIKLAQDGKLIWAYNYHPNGNDSYQQHAVDELYSHNGYFIGGYAVDGSNDEGYLAKTTSDGKAGACEIQPMKISVTTVQPIVAPYTWPDISSISSWEPISITTADVATRDSMVCPQCCVSSKSEIDTAVCAGTSFKLPDGTLVTKSGSYPVKFVSSTGCDSIITTNLTILPLYKDTIYDSICPYQTFQLPDGQTVNTAGNYTSTLRSTSGCDSLIITILALRQPIRDTVRDSICPMQNYILPDGTTVNQPGEYPVTLTSSEGCDSIVNTILTQRAPIQAALSDSFCVGKTYTLPDGRIVDTTGTYESILKSEYGCDSIVTTTLKYKSFINDYRAAVLCYGDSLLLPDNRYIKSPGIYQVRISSSTTCDTMATFVVSLKYPPYFDLGPDTCIIGSQTLLLSPGSYDEYLWQDGSSLPTYLASRPGTYWVTASDLCGDATDTIKISDDCIPTLFLPSAFTPNGDGMNDRFRILNVHGQKLTFFNVYDRWGEMVFHTSDIAEFWDGRVNGKRAPMGTYVYLVRYIDLDGTLKELKGSVVLIR